MSSGLVFSYGDYNFSPRPLFTINNENFRTVDGSGYGRRYSLSLDGNIILNTGAALNSGILGVFAEIERLNSALDKDGKLLLISCNNQPIISGYPIITSFNVEPAGGDNYTRRADYTIDFEMPTTISGGTANPFNNSSLPPYIENVTETWDVQFNDERMPFDWTLRDGTIEKFGYSLAVTHQVDVQARIVYTGSLLHNTPWQDARDYASGRLGFDSEMVTLTGILGLPGGGYFSKFDTFNHFRQVATNKTDGSVSVTETFIVTPSGSNSLPNNAIETFDISTSQQDGIVSISINGNIQGLASISYTGDAGSNVGFYVNNSKFSAASGYYNIVKDRFYDRARTIYSGIADSCFNVALNPQVRSRTVGMNPIEGTVSYDYQYDTTPDAIIGGSCVISQNITIDDQLESDVFASQVVLGRAVGPILQDIGTVTARVRTVNIELVTTPPTGYSTVNAIYAPVPTGEIQAFIDTISGDLVSNYSQVFVSTQTQNWNPTVGRYTKTIGFTYNNC